MRRYLLVSLLIGVAVSAAVLLLLRGGGFAPVGEALGRLYVASGWWPAMGDEGPARIVSGRVLEPIVAVLAAFAAAWWAIEITQFGHKLLVILALLLVLAGLSATLALYGVLYEPVSAAAAALLAAAAGLLYAGTEHGGRKRLLLGVLGSRVSPATFRELMDSPEPVRLAGGTRAVSVLSCRVFNHAELRGRLAPAELVAMSNLFLRTTADFLLARGAYLDESSPDMVRVIFGLLQPSPGHAEAACRAALALRARLRNLNDECETRWFQRLACGVAICSGEMTAGVYGSPRGQAFSGVGEEADFSRRLAGANRRYGSDLLIAARTYELAKDSIEVRPLEMLYDPDRDLMTEMYQLLALAGELTAEDKARRDAYWEGVLHYRAGRRAGARTSFARAAQPGREDGPLRYFTALCEEPEPLARPSPEAAAPAHARWLGTI